MTLGIVSNPERVFTDFTGTSLEDLDFGGGNKTGMFTQWIQHDALILPGNSGGPLCNLKGEIVGINTRGGSGVGFATPSTLVSKVLNQILTHGRVRRGYLGIGLAPVAKLGLDMGVLVASVSPESPAAKAKLQPGDLLVALDGKPVDGRFFEQVPPLYQRIAELRIGGRTTARVERAGKTIDVELDVADMEEFVGRQAEIRALGVTAQEITGPMARARRYPSSDAVLITGLRPGRSFENARPRIHAGDVVLSIDGKPVSNLAAFEKALGGDSKKERRALELWRSGQSLLSVVKTESKKPPRSGGELSKAWIGIETQVLTPDVAAAMGCEGMRGLRITRVLPDTKALAAGLRVGDIVRSFDGEELESYREQDAKDLETLVEEYSSGESVQVELQRGAEKLEVALELEKTPTPSSEAKTEKNDDFEFAVREVMFRDRIKRRWDDSVKGVIATESTRGGWANLAGLRVGDLILRVADHDVSDLTSFKQAMTAVRESKPTVVPVLLRRGSGTRFVFFDTAWSDE